MKRKRRLVDLDDKWCQGEALVIAADEKGAAVFYHGGVSMTNEEAGELLAGGAVPMFEKRRKGNPRAEVI